MHVSALRNARTVLRALRQCVTVEHYHALEVIRERACRRQSAHAGPENQCLSTDRVSHRTPPSRSDDQLPGRLPGLDVAMRIGGLGQRERLADVDAEPTLAHELEATVRALAELVVKRPDHRRQRERTHLERLREKRDEAEGIGRAAGAAVKDEMPEWRQTAKSLLHCRLADCVQDEVGAAVLGEP